MQIHLNYGECAPVEMAILHDRLEREFIRRRHTLLDERCDGELVWPKDQPFRALCTALGVFGEREGVHDCLRAAFRNPAY
jgi:hypothetical protein